MTRSALTLSPVLALLAACTTEPDGADASDTQSSDSASATATADGTETGTSDGTDTGTGSDCAQDACAASSEDYCYPCDPESSKPDPWLTLGGASGFADGGTMKIICGGQGSWMFEIRPAFGGFTLEAASVAIDYEVHIDDFNIIGGKFASGSKSVPMLCCDTTQPYDYESGLYACNQNYIGSCYSYSGGLNAIRFFPPDSIPLLTDLDGKGVQIDMMLHAGSKGAQPFHFEGTVSATQPWEDCTYYDHAPDPGSGTENDEDPFDWVPQTGIPS